MFVKYPVSYRVTGARERDKANSRWSHKWNMQSQVRKNRKWKKKSPETLTKITYARWREKMVVWCTREISELQSGRQGCRHDRSRLISPSSTRMKWSRVIGAEINFLTKNDKVWKEFRLAPPIHKSPATFWYHCSLLPSILIPDCVSKSSYIPSLPYLFSSIHLYHLYLMPL